MSKKLCSKDLQSTFIRFEALQAPPTNVTGDVNLIFDWAKQLKEAHKTDDNEAWWLAGRAITILNDDVERCHQTLKYAAWHAGFHFYAISGNSLQATLKSLKNTAFEHPSILYIEPGSWMFKIKDDVSSKVFNKLTETKAIIRSFISASNSRCGSAMVTSISKDDFSNFDTEFRQVHLFSRRFHLEAAPITEVADRFIQNIGKDLCDDSLIDKPHEVSSILQMQFEEERRQALIALSMKRLAKREQRKVGYVDLMHFVANGSAEFSNPEEINLESARRIAIHEAGHAAIAIIDSNGQDIPEYVSIKETNNYKGVMIDSIAYQHSKSNIFTYQQFRHKVRVTLAGRVAEHLVLGAENIGCHGARNDLEKATNMTGSMFALYGISPNMEDSDAAAQNLIVISESSEPTALDSQRIDQMVNTYLEKQYHLVYEQLVNHRPFFESIVEKLMQNPILVKDDLIEIAKGAGILTKQGSQNNR